MAFIITRTLYLLPLPRFLLRSCNRDGSDKTGKKKVEIFLERLQLTAYDEEEEEEEKRPGNRNSYFC